MKIKNKLDIKYPNNIYDKYYQYWNGIFGYFYTNELILKIIIENNLIEKSARQKEAR